MSKKSLKQEERKVKVCITLDPKLYQLLDEQYSNKSKYIEKLIALDLLNK